MPRKFNFGLTNRHPLVPLSAVTIFLDKSAREILALIEEGRLRWAFDIRSPDAKVKQVRVLRQSIFECAGFFDRDPSRTKKEETEVVETMDLILPKGIIFTARNNLRKNTTYDLQIKLRLTPSSFQKALFPPEPLVRGTEIARCFACNNQHVINLIRKKSLGTASLRCGPKASPLVTRSSAIEFLKSRRMS